MPTMASMLTAKLGEGNPYYGILRDPPAAKVLSKFGLEIPGAQANSETPVAASPDTILGVTASLNTKVDPGMIYRYTLFNNKVGLGNTGRSTLLGN